MSIEGKLWSIAPGNISFTASPAGDATSGSRKPGEVADARPKTRIGG
jgi:hypothetical protein